MRIWYPHNESGLMTHWRRLAYASYWNQGIMDANVEQAWNVTRVLLKIASIVSGTDTYPTGYNWQKMHWNTNKVRESDGAVETSYLLSALCTIIRRILSSKKTPLVTELDTGTNSWSIPYHETVSVGVSCCFFQQRQNQRPDTDVVSHDLHQRRHREVTWHNSTSQGTSRCHPVLMLSDFQSDNDKLRHRKRIQIAKDEWGTLMKASLEEPQVEDEVLDQLLPVPTASKFDVRVAKHMWSHNQSNKRHWGSNNTQERPTKSSVTTGISLYLLSTATHTLRNVSRSNVRTKRRVASDPSSNSTLNWPHDFTQFTTLNKICGYIPFRKIDCKQNISNENLDGIRNYSEQLRNFPEANTYMIRKRYGY